MSVDADAFRAAVSRFVTGITVITTFDGDGEHHGMTANAVTSLSLDPTLLLFCVDRGATMAAVVQTGGAFAVNVLAADQEELSARFADPARGYGEVEFEGVLWRTGVSGARLLEGTASWLDCGVHDVHDGGDHLIVVGRVLDVGVGGSGDALLYTSRGYDRWEPAD